MVEVVGRSQRGKTKPGLGEVARRLRRSWRWFNLGHLVWDMVGSLLKVLSVSLAVRGVTDHHSQATHYRGRHENRCHLP